MPRSNWPQSRGLCSGTPGRPGGGLPTQSGCLAHLVYGKGVQIVLDHEVDLQREREWSCSVLCQENRNVSKRTKLQCVPGKWSCSVCQVPTRQLTGCLRLCLPSRTLTCTRGRKSKHSSGHSKSSGTPRKCFPRPVSSLRASRPAARSDGNQYNLIVKPGLTCVMEKIK